MFHKVQTLKTVNDKIAVYDEIIEKYGQSDDLGIQKYIAESMLNKGILIEKSEEKTTIYCKPPQKPYHLKQNNSDKINQESSCERVSSQRDRLLVS